MKELEYCIRVATNCNADADVGKAKEELKELKEYAELGKALSYCYEYEKGFISAYGHIGIRITQSEIQKMLLLYRNRKKSKK